MNLSTSGVDMCQTEMNGVVRCQFFLCSGREHSVFLVSSCSDLKKILSFLLHCAHGWFMSFCNGSEPLCCRPTVDRPQSDEMIQDVCPVCRSWEANRSLPLIRILPDWWILLPGPSNYWFLFTSWGFSQVLSVVPVVIHSSWPSWWEEKHLWPSLIKQNKIQIRSKYLPEQNQQKYPKRHIFVQFSSR